MGDRFSYRRRGVVVVVIAVFIFVCLWRVFFRGRNVTAFDSSFFLTALIRDESYIKNPVYESCCSSSTRHDARALRQRGDRMYVSTDDEVLS